MKSIRWKLIIMYIALVFIVMVSSGTFMIITIRSNEETKAMNTLKDRVKLIEETVIKEFASGDFQEKFSQGILGLQSNNDGIYAILDITGETLASSEVAPVSDVAAPVYVSSVIIAAGEGEKSFAAGRTFTDSLGLSKPCVEYAAPFFNMNGDVLFVSYCRMDMTAIYDGISQTTNTIFMALFLAMVLTGILGFLFSSSLTVPIAILTSKAKELAEGNLNQKIPVNSGDEIGQLTESFNYMAHELSVTMHEMENEKNKLEIVLYNMTDGVLAYDNNGTLIHANQISKELIGYDDIDSTDFFEMAARLNVEINGSIDQINHEHIMDSSLYVGEKYINASLNPYRNNENKIEGIIILLQDITKHKMLDDMRKEFVGNVSHEIRTPLTTIKSYTETLLDGAIEDKELAADFLSIINGEADRMALIVKDLLELSSLDNKQLVLDLKEVDLFPLIKRVVKQHSLTAKKQHIKIDLEPGKENCIVLIDEQRIIQVFSNIITNAIKYSGEGSEIHIRMVESAEHYAVYIKDNGIGIPKEDLRRIFERFYRVDKARSRELGGTGLGLSIAQEIMELHGGKISAASELGKGTTMVVRFKKWFGDEDLLGASPQTLRGLSPSTH